MASVYILYSPSFDKFYVGATTITADLRQQRHLTKYYENKYTAITNDWEAFFAIDCSSMKQALQIEKHIKNMKSKKYITDLKKYPEMALRLKEKYPG